MEQAPRRITWIAFALNFIVYSENFVVAPFLRRLAELTGSTPAAMANLVLVYTLGIGFGALLLGPLGDRYGRRPMLLAGLGAFALFTGLTGAVSGYEALIVTRALCGVAAGVLLSSLMAYMADIFIAAGRLEAMPGAMGTAMGGIFAAIVFGVPAGIYAGYLVDWSLAFFVLALLAVVVLALVALALPAVPGMKSGLSYLGLLTSGFRLFTEPRLLLIGASFFLFQFVATAFGTHSPAWILSHGIGLDMLALLYAATGAVSVLAALRSGALIGRIGPAVALLLTNAVVLVALIGIAMAGFGLVPLGLLLAAYLAGLAVRMGLIQAIATSSVDRMARGRFMGINNFLMQMGSSAGVWLLTLTLRTVPDPDAAFRIGVLGLAGVTLVSLLLGLVLLNPLRRATPAAPGKGAA